MPDRSSARGRAPPPIRDTTRLALAHAWRSLLSIAQSRSSDCLPVSLAPPQDTVHSPLPATASPGSKAQPARDIHPFVLSAQQADLPPAYSFGCSDPLRP